MPWADGLQDALWKISLRVHPWWKTTHLTFNLAIAHAAIYWQTDICTNQSVFRQMIQSSVLEISVPLLLRPNGITYIKASQHTCHWTLFASKLVILYTCSGFNRTIIFIIAVFCIKFHFNLRNVRGLWMQ